ncbi:MAG TPA: hypothetical protein VMB71_08475 [Acetobacteraceae bacterium]|nr:hypothetical protein [Acetobacteraceae bacterium]
MSSRSDTTAGVSRAENWATILIPTRDSAAWIAAVLAHYLDRDCCPTLLVDARTRDATREIAHSFGVAVHDLAGFTVTEAAVQASKEIVRTPWTLWVHDDEIPSDELFIRLAKAPPPESVTSVAIQRRWAWYEPDMPLTYGRSRFWRDRARQAGADHMWRLFRQDCVTFVPAMHSDGFRIGKWCRLPADCYIVHFEWIIRSHTERVDKLRRYDAVRPGYGRFFENIYLPEGQPSGAIDYHPFESSVYESLARTYYDARCKRAPLGEPTSSRADILSVRGEQVVVGAEFAQDPEDRTGLSPCMDLEVLDVW